MAKLTTVISLLSLLYAGILQANVPVKNTVPALDPSKAVNQPGLAFMQNYKGKNQIKLLNNRFRIDAEVEEIMLLFFRKHGSAPVVLVRPDGSKLYPKDADIKKLTWHDDLAYDLIQLKDPMPGPWQALGKILPDSKILVLSDVELQVDPFPSQVYQYEQIKTQARIVNAGHIINEPGFHEVVRLRAHLYSTNDSDAENFGADIFKLGEFLDNGKDLDERRRDGIFTVAYDVNAVPGRWLPKYKVNAALFSRELEQDPIHILPNPVTLSEKLASEGERYHYVYINVDDSNLNNDELIFQGTIQFPNGETQTFNISQQQKRELEIFQNDYGRFVIETQVFGTDKSGREFVLNLPEFGFVTSMPEMELSLPEEMSAEQQAMEQAAAEQKVIEQQKEEEVPVLLIVIINLAILLFGLLVIWMFVLKRDIPNPMTLIKRKKKVTEDEDTKTEDKEIKKDAKPQSSDDILDLSLPDD